MSSEVPKNDVNTRSAKEWRGQLERLARELHGSSSGKDESTQHTVLADATAAAVRLIPAADHAGVTLIRRKIKKRGDARVAMELNASTGPRPQAR